MFNWRKFIGMNDEEGEDEKMDKYGIVNLAKLTMEVEAIKYKLERHEERHKKEKKDAEFDELQKRAKDIGYKLKYNPRGNPFDIFDEIERYHLIKDDKVIYTTYDIDGVYGFINGIEKDRLLAKEVNHGTSEKE